MSATGDRRVDGDIYADAVALADGDVDFNGIQSLAVVPPSTYFASGTTSWVTFHALQPAEMLAWGRWQLGWLTSEQVRCVTGPQATVTLGPAAQPGGELAMAAVPLNAREVIVAESRQRPSRRLPAAHRGRVGDGEGLHHHRHHRRWRHAHRHRRTSELTGGL